MMKYIGQEGPTLLKVRRLSEFEGYYVLYILYLAATTYRYGSEIPRVEYSEAETSTWGTVYKKLQMLYPKYACSQFNRILPL